ncbi:hypothetical protein ACFV2Z_19805 [Streptomyces sp. NPDC059688]|uniref:hypothetical protein n=1 Tax=Streptomyces sp. NPDC059688 TaxID=3346906 RepID=UPI00368A5764
MTKFLLAVHVLAAIVAVGPVTVAASMFPPVARRVLAAPPAGSGTAALADDDTEPVIPASDDPGAADDPAGTLRLLYRICRVYAVVGVVVPVFGFATASRMGVLGDAWLITSIALTALAAVVLAALVLPAQTMLVEGDGTVRHTARLATYTGVFNMLWATVTVLMIVRPGSTTGA